MTLQQKKRIEEAIIEYAILKKSHAYRNDISITSILSHAPKGTNTSDKVGNQAVKNLITDDKISIMEKAFENLSFKEKLIIERTYINTHNKEGFTVIAENSFMSYQTFRKYKKSAFKKIGLFLNII